MAKKFRGSSVKRGNLIEMYGVSELLQNIEAAGGKADKAVKKAVDASLEYVGMKMQLFMMEHRETGETYLSFEQKKASSRSASKVDDVKYKSKGSVVVGNVGYNIEKGGLPAIFLDVGTPKQKPYFFRYYAIEESRQQIEEIQRATLNEILADLQKKGRKK